MNPSSQQARTVVDELVRHGVRDAVLCPGSRSAPLAFALAEADQQGRLRLHVRIDERGAGYLALGLAIASGQPVPVVVTSGTAVANLHPAVVEAHYSSVPLLLLTADRPPELHGSGANQTIEQSTIFGPHVRATIDFGTADASIVGSEKVARWWRSTMSRAVLAATNPRYRGPVHVNIALRDPLVPEDDHGDDTFSGRPEGKPWIDTPPSDIADQSQWSLYPLDLSKSTIVVAGAGSWSVAALRDCPTVAEPVAPAPRRPVHPGALDDLHPQQVVVVGRPTLHRSVSRLLSRPDVEVVALTRTPQWSDVAGSVSVVAGGIDPVGEPDRRWLARCESVHLRATAAVVEVLSRAASNGLVTGLHVAQVLVESLRENDRVVVGASNPIRDTSLVGLPRKGVSVFANRGASGIDGNISTAVGVALSTTGRTIALIGDLTFLHDMTGLIRGPQEPVPDDLTIVVANDDGGGIFSLLEQGDEQYAAVFERVFGTPHGCGLGDVASGLGVPHRVVDLEQLRKALAPGPPSGIRILEVRTTRAELRGLHQQLRVTSS